MNIEGFKTEILAIRARHRCPEKTWSEVFQFIQTIVQQLDGVPVTGEFKRALREELDRAYFELPEALRA